MSKQEFLEKLRMALSGRVAPALVEENVSYYEEYINTQVRMGKSEDSVLCMLGDPRLIAKSIISANSEDEFVDARHRNQKENMYEEEKYYSESYEEKQPKVIRVHGWITTIIVIVVILIAAKLLFSLLTLLFPIVLIGGIVIFFMKLFRDWLK